MTYKQYLLIAFGYFLMGAFFAFHADAWLAWWFAAMVGPLCFMAGARWAWSRGYLQHAVAWDGFTAHDPHPTRAGLTTISHLIEFEEAPDAR